MNGEEENLTQIHDVSSFKDSRSSAFSHEMSHSLVIYRGYSGCPGPLSLPCTGVVKR